jgi:hypothetical protein
LKSNINQRNSIICSIARLLNSSSLISSSRRCIIVCQTNRIISHSVIAHGTCKLDINGTSILSTFVIVVSIVWNLYVKQSNQLYLINDFFYYKSKSINESCSK